LFDSALRFKIERILPMIEESSSVIENKESVASSLKEQRNYN